MANDRTIRVTREHVIGDWHLEIEVYYEEGGTNYFNGRNEPRGYRLLVNPVQIEVREIGGRVFESRLFQVGGGGGRRLFLEESTRFNRKKLEALAATCQERPEYEGMRKIALDHVATKVAEAAAKVAP